MKRIFAASFLAIFLTGCTVVFAYHRHTWTGNPSGEALPPTGLVVSSPSSQPSQMEEVKAVSFDPLRMIYEAFYGKEKK